MAPLKTKVPKGMKPAGDWRPAFQDRFVQTYQPDEEQKPDRPKVERRPFIEWSGDVPVPGFGALDFKRFPYQRELYEGDFVDAREVVIQKATQVGISELGWRWATWMADQWGNTVLYVFPTTKHVSDFGDERIEPAILESPYLLSRIAPKSVKQKTLKNIGAGWLYLRGSESKAGAQSVAADAAILDEYDELNEKNIPQIERRLSGAMNKGRVPRIRRIGVPRLPEYGINASFLESDQRKWHVTCPKCQFEQHLNFTDNVRWLNPGSKKVQRQGHDKFEDRKKVDKVWRVCAKCEAEIDVSVGRWIATQPNMSTPGYHVPRLIHPYTDLAQIVTNSRLTKTAEVETFHQNDLGEAFQSADASLSREAVAAACSFGIEMQAGYRGTNFVTMGVDVASARELSVRISEHMEDGKRRALWVGEVEDFNELQHLMVNYRVHMCAVDANPERRMAYAFAANFPGRVFLVSYNGLFTSDVFVYDRDKNMATVNRTLMIDGVLDSIRVLENFPPVNPPDGYVDHLCALHRISQVKESANRSSSTDGQIDRRYVSTSADDYAHAEVYDLCATHFLSMRIAEQQLELEAGGTALTDAEMGINRINLDKIDGDYYGGLDDL